MGEATRRLENAHRPGKLLNTHQEAAIQRLQDLEKVGKYGPDIVLKIFNDIGTILFRGVLNGNVSLDWMSHNKIMCAAGGSAAGLTSHAGMHAERVRVLLKRGVMQLSASRLRDATSTLVHAYIL